MSDVELWLVPRIPRLDESLLIPCLEEGSPEPLPEPREDISRLMEQQSGSCG